MTLTRYLYSRKHQIRLTAFSQATGRTWTMDRVETIAKQVPPLSNVALVLDKHSAKVCGGRATGHALVAVIRYGVCKTIMLADNLSESALRVENVVELAYA